MFLLSKCKEKNKMQTTQTTRTEQPRQMLRVDPENLGRIEELIQQWQILDEHFTRHNLNRHEQLEESQRIYKRLQAELKRAYSKPEEYQARAA
jgi:hypothetical protein